MASASPHFYFQDISVVLLDGSGSLAGIMERNDTQ